MPPYDGFWGATSCVHKVGEWRRKRLADTPGSRSLPAILRIPEMRLAVRVRGGRTLGVLLCAFACLAPGLAPPAWADPFQTAHFDFGGLARTYSLHVPAGVEHPSGLVINLHGAGATGPDQAALTHFDSVADAHGFVVAYPDGIDLSWADGRGASIPDRQGVDDVGFISALVGKLVTDFGIDPGRVFATGMSAGAFMTNRLACERADLFAAVAPVAGTLGVNVACNPSRPVAVLMTHGTADPVVPYNGGIMMGRGGVSDIPAVPTLVERWRQIDGCQGVPGEDVLPTAGDGTQSYRLTSSACSGGTEVVLVRVDGGGHSWFDTSEASWQFFNAHAR